MASNNQLPVDLTLNAKSTGNLQREINANMAGITAVLNDIQLSPSAKSGVIKQILDMTSGLTPSPVSVEVDVDKPSVDLSGLVDSARAAGADMASAISQATESALGGMTAKLSSSALAPIKELATLTKEFKSIDEISKFALGGDAGEKYARPARGRESAAMEGSPRYRGGEPVNCWKAPISSPVPKRSGKPQTAAA